MEIAYCDKCGSKLSAADLASRTAAGADVCSKCRATVPEAVKASATPAGGMRRPASGGVTRQNSEGRGAVSSTPPRGTARKSSGNVPHPPAKGPGTPRPGSVRRDKLAMAGASAKGNSGTWLYISIAALVLLGLAYLTFSGGTPKPASATQTREKKEAPK